MTIINGTRGLECTIVIAILIFPEIAVQGASPSDSAADNVSVPFRPQDNTVRLDPLDHLKNYRGGFNITNKHYWGSVVFTGVYGYAIGVLCFLCGMVYGVSLVTTKFCCKSDEGRRRKKIFPCNYNSCDLSLIPLAILLLLAMAASGFVLAWSARFYSQARTSVNIIIQTANEASETINNATEALKDFDSGLANYGVSTEASVNLNSTAEKFDAASARIVKKTRKNRRMINKAFKVVSITTTVIISFILVAVTALSVSGVLRLRMALYLLVIVCWLMTVICWLLFGVYFFLENFSNDACTAFDNFEGNPYNNSLSSILPCDELLSAKSVLSDVGAGIYNLVNAVNANLSFLQAALSPDLLSVCNPFSAPPQYLYQPQKCQADTIQIGDIPKVLKPFTCFDNGTCDKGDFMSGSEYETVEAFTSSIQELLNVYPGMENLLGCQLVKDAFSQLLLKHCKPLKKFARMVWGGLVFLAVIIVLLVVLWTMKARYEHNHHHSDGSVQPHSAAGNALELGPAQ